MLHKRIKLGNHFMVISLFPAIIAMISIFICNCQDIQSQDLSEIDQQTAIMQYTIKYRFGKDLKVGDWVKYSDKSSGDESVIELKVTGNENGNLWIQEKSGGSVINYLYNPQQLSCIKVSGKDKDGNNIDISPMSEEKLSGIIGMFKNRMKQQGSFTQFVAWTVGSGPEKISTDAGSFNCVFLEPEFSEMYTGQIKQYEKSLREQGKTEEEIHRVVYGQVPKLFFNKDVPKMLPMNIAIGWMPWIESFEAIDGGLIECRHMAPLVLTGYSK